MSIRVTNLSMSFGRRTLWKNLSAEFPSGSIVGITGKSGSGKSTLLYCLGGMIKPTNGSIFIDDVDILKTSNRYKQKLRRKTYGFLFQNYGLSSEVNVERNLAVAFPHMFFTTSKRRQKMEEALNVVGLNKEILRAPVFQLSGGEQQRVALARILLREPTVILADEPTGALDKDNTDVVMGHLRRFANRGAVVIVATHDDNVKNHCDYVLDLSALDSGLMVVSADMTYPFVGDG